MIFNIDSKTARASLTKEAIAITPEIKLKAIHYCGYSDIPVETVDERTYIYNWYYERLHSNLNNLSEATSFLLYGAVSILDKIQKKIFELHTSDDNIRYEREVLSPEVLELKDLFARHTSGLCGLLDVPYGPPSQELIDKWKTEGHHQEKIKKSTLASIELLKSVDDEALKLIVQSDPEMIRAVALAASELIALIAPFAEKAVKWDANHPGGTYGFHDTHQISHRLGDFRACNVLLKTFKE